MCKPYAAYALVKALRDEVGVPIHFHTHDTSGINAASILRASDAGVDIVDGALAAMSGMTSQPNLNSLVAALQNTPRDTGLDLDALNQLSDYWEGVREFYYPFEEEMKVRHGRGVSARDARRAIHQSPPAGQEPGPGRPLARDRRRVCRGEPALRRHREGDAVEQSGRRPGAVHGDQQPDGDGRARTRARS